MLGFTCVAPDIFRLLVPFIDVYTSVFLIDTPRGPVILDVATTDDDVNGWIVPALAARGIHSDTPLTIVLSHDHEDHAGGLARMMATYPQARVLSHSEVITQAMGDRGVLLSEGDLVCDVLRVVEIPGHSVYAIGLIDTRTKTLLSGDSLQQAGLYGSGGWGCAIGAGRAHRKVLQKLRGMELQTIIASHAYAPFGYRADGAMVAEMLTACETSLDRLCDLIRSHTELSPNEMAQLYRETERQPPVAPWVFDCLRKEILEDN